MVFTVYQALFSLLYKHYLVHHYSNPRRHVLFLISTSQRSRLRHREVRYLSRSHIASRQWNQGLKPGHLAPEYMLSTTMLSYTCNWLETAKSSTSHMNLFHY